MPGLQNLSRSQLAARRKHIADLYLRGNGQIEIASELGISQATVSRELAYWQKVWEKSTIEEIHKAKLLELARIDRLEVVAWKAWEKSCKDAESYHVETTKGRTAKDGAPLPTLERASKTVKGQAGDPRFLERVGWCIDERCKILGLLKQTHEHSGPGGAPIPVKHEHHVNPAEFADAFKAFAAAVFDEGVGQVREDGSVQFVDPAQAKQESDPSSAS